MIERAFIVEEPFGSLILSGKKSWEVRSRRCSIRGEVGIIIKGTGLVQGSVEIVDCIPMTKELFDNNRDKHHILCSYEALPDNYKYGKIWVMQNAKYFDTPIKYERKAGQQIWVRLDNKE